MRCEKAKRLISCYVDNELRSAQTITKLEKHIQSCEACGQYLHDLKHMKKMLTAHQTISPRPGFADSVMDAIYRRPVRENRFTNALIPTFAMIIAIVIAGVTFSVLKVNRAATVRHYLVEQISLDEMRYLYHNTDNYYALYNKAEE